MINLILCGGSGTRLWPISRSLMPKQFVKMFAGKSLFELTALRNQKLVNSTFIISNTEQYFLAQDQLEKMDQQNTQYLLEPIAKNTAPALALACFALKADEIVLVTPSDHLIKNQTNYEKAVKSAKKLAIENNIVTFGIKPLFAHTGYGYIESKGNDVQKFHEKPEQKKAQEFIDSKNFSWNSGMFCFKAGLFLQELELYGPDIYNASKKAFLNAKKYPIIRIKHEDMANIPEQSIDYALMEKSKKIKIVQTDMNWSDLGSFDALFDELPKDENQNTVNKNHISIQSSNNLVYGKEKCIATIGIKDTIIVDTGDALLISKKDCSQKLKQVVAKVKKTTNLHNIHLTGYRPWGSYTVLEEAKGYKIKRIVVKPMQRISLQKHLHRNEHWTVISGVATVTIDDKTSTLRANESIFIKMGQVHRLANNGKIELVIIETQVGEYTGEDDIIRLNDDYDRE